MTAKKWTAALALLLGLTASACGGSDEETQDTTGDQGSGMPACSEVWAEGETLPADYEGCLREDTIDAVTSVKCGDGDLFTLDDELYGIPGEKITTTRPDC